MTVIKTFLLPDLGEGLPDATIVEWHVKEGDEVALDAPLVSMETAKAMVDVPSPHAGKIARLHGKAQDVIATGTPLVDFEIAAAEGAPPAEAGATNAPEHRAATVVGNIATGNEVRAEAPLVVGGVRALPAVRAMARKLKVDLARVTPTGADGVVTIADVQKAAAQAPAAAPSQPARQATPATAGTGAKPLTGVRRTMARVMADAHARVVATTTMDDADLHQWTGRQDITVRLIRAIVSASAAVPLMNAWFDDEALTLTEHRHVDVGIAVDSPDGLFVPVLRQAQGMDAATMRATLVRLRQGVLDRSIAASELAGHTISLSNYGMLGGRYATPVLVPPCVAIVGAGRISHDVVTVIGGLEAHRRLPISLTFDHRVATGGEASRFMRALLDDLELPG